MQDRLYNIHLTNPIIRDTTIPCLDFEIVAKILSLPDDVHFEASVVHIYNATRDWDGLGIEINGWQFGTSILFKGQLISKCPFEMIVSSKVVPKLFLDFCPEIFVPSWGLPGSFLGLPVGSLVYDITYWVPRKPKKLPGSPQEATKKIRAEIQK